MSQESCSDKECQSQVVSYILASRLENDGIAINELGKILSFPNGLQSGTLVDAISNCDLLELQGAIVTLKPDFVGLLIDVETHLKFEINKSAKTKDLRETFANQLSEVDLCELLRLSPKLILSQDLSIVYLHEGNNEEASCIEINEIPHRLVNVGGDHTLNFVVRNKTNEVKTLVSCVETLSKAGLAGVMSPFVVAGPTNNQLHHNQSLTVPIILRNDHVGKFVGEFLFIFIGIPPIIRKLSVSCGDSSAHELLKPSQPYTRTSKTRRFKQGKLNVMQWSTGRSFVVPLPDYPLQLSSNTDQLRDMLRELRRIFETNPSDFLSSGEFSTMCHKLLFSEEEYAMKELERFSMEGTNLLRPTGSHFKLHVSGLAENRPSVRINDIVDVKIGKKVFAGNVEDVSECDLFLSFGNKFKSEYNTSKVVQIQFRIRRTFFKLQHFTLDHKMNSAEQLLLPKFQPKLQAVIPGCVHYFDNTLNPRQQLAVDSMVCGDHAPFPFVLFGPPGTGKTTTLVEAIRQISSKNGSRSKILLCAPSNSAANILVTKLHEHCEISNLKLFRLCAASCAKASMSDVVLSHTEFDGDFFVFPTNDEIAEYDIVVSTCATASKLFQHGVNPGHFQVVGIDEAGFSTETESFAGFLNLWVPGVRVILAGDPKQLGPVVVSPLAKEFGLGTSWIERLMLTNQGYCSSRTRFAPYSGYDPSYIVKLVTSYRCHPEILAVPNKLFYDGDMICEFPQELSCVNFSLLPNPQFPLICHNCIGQNIRESNSPSWFNIEECQVVLGYCHNLLGNRQYNITASDIGVITPYHKQVQKLRTLLGSKGMTDIDVGSCEQFQGREKRVIIISTVRSDPEQLHEDKYFNLGFVNEPRRLNVAITRAQGLLIVVGNLTVLHTDDVWREFIDHCNLHGGMAGSVFNTV